MGDTAKDDGTMIKKIDEDRWSHIPSLLLWMIKDKLNIADSARVAFVCKNWKSVSLTYPSKPKAQQQGIVPWLMLKIPFIDTDTDTDTACEFINLSTKESFTVNLTETHYYETSFLNSRCGWLLFPDVSYSSARGGSVNVPVCVCSIVLLNLHTNAKMTIPFQEQSMVQFMTSFSVSSEDGIPQYVVSATMCATRRSRTLYIACVSDYTWTEHYYSENDRIMEIAVSLVVQGHKIYLLDLEGGLVIFDMAKLSWQKLDNTDREIAYIYDEQLYIMESEQGEILMIDRGMDLRSFSFFRLNETQTGWEELTTTVNNQQDKRCWFLSHQNNHFSAKEFQEETKKVYELISGREQHIRIHDLTTNGSTQDIKPGILCGVWVDLGWMDKLPPTCVSYGPSIQW